VSNRKEARFAHIQEWHSRSREHAGRAPLTLGVIILPQVPSRRHSKVRQSHVFRDQRRPCAWTQRKNPATATSGTLVILVSRVIDVVQLFGDLPPRVSKRARARQFVQQLTHILSLQKRMMFSPAIGWHGLGSLPHTEAGQVAWRVGAVKVVRIHFNVAHRNFWKVSGEPGVTTAKRIRRIQGAQLRTVDDRSGSNQSLISAWKSCPHSVSSSGTRRQVSHRLLSRCQSPSVGSSRLLPARPLSPSRSCVRTFRLSDALKLGGGDKVQVARPGLGRTRLRPGKGAVDRHGKRLADFEVRQDRVRNWRKRFARSPFCRSGDRGSVMFISDPFDQGTDAESPGTLRLRPFFRQYVRGASCMFQA